MSAAVRRGCLPLDGRKGSWLRIVVYRVDTATGDRVGVSESVVVGAVAERPFTDRWPPCECRRCQGV